MTFDLLKLQFIFNPLRTEPADVSAHAQKLSRCLCVEGAGRKEQVQGSPIHCVC